MVGETVVSSVASTNATPNTAQISQTPLVDPVLDAAQTRVSILFLHIVMEMDVNSYGPAGDALLFDDSLSQLADDDHYDGQPRYHFRFC